MHYSLQFKTGVHLLKAELTQLPSPTRIYRIASSKKRKIIAGPFKWTEFEQNLNYSKYKPPYQKYEYMALHFMPIFELSITTVFIGRHKIIQILFSFTLFYTVFLYLQGSQLCFPTFPVLYCTKIRQWGFGRKWSAIM